MKLRLLMMALLIGLSCDAAVAQQNEFAFTSGGLKIGERGFDLPRPGFIKFSTGFTYELNYARRLVDAKIAARVVSGMARGCPARRITQS